MFISLGGGGGGAAPPRPPPPAGGGGGGGGAPAGPPPTLTFTTTNWNSPQDFAITGADDLTVDGNQASTVVLTAASADGAYDGLAATVNVTTTDDDAAGFTATATDGTTEVSEFGSSDTISVVLSTQPTGPVVISVTASDPSEAFASPTVLTFTSTNWNVAQDVTVGGMDDIEEDGDVTSKVTLAVVEAASAGEFAPVADVELDVTTIDDDEPVTEEPEDVLPEDDDDSDDDTNFMTLTVHSVCFAVELSWTVDVGTAVDFFTVAVKFNEGAWDMDSIEPQPGSSAGMTLPGRANGTHVFEVQAILVDGSTVDSGEVTTEVLECTPIELTPEPDPTPEVDPTPEPCLLYTSPSPRDGLLSRMPSSA